METIEAVIGRRGPHLARILVSELGFSMDRAERFVSLAGDDLVVSYRLRAGDIDPGELSDPDNVRELLGAIRGNRIASSLGMPPAEVWNGLRALVPRVLRLADRRYAHEA